MTFVANLLWFVFGGFIMCLEWAILGIVLGATVVGIPFSIAAFRIAGFAAFPFGRELVEVEMLNERRVVGTALGNALWIILAGFWLALGHAIIGIVFCMFVITIPFGLAHFKLSQACFAPLGKRIVTREMAAAATFHYHNAVMQQRFAPQMVTTALMPAPVAMPMAAPSRFCHACGTQLNVTAIICSKCGSAQRPI